jgi:hypothetical protein
MQHLREHPARAAENATEGACDGAEDEPPRRQPRQIGDERGHEIAEVQLARLHEVADGVLGRGEGPDQRIADIRADVARSGGVVLIATEN